MKNKLRKPINLDSWILISSKRDKQDRNDTVNLVREMQFASKVFGIEVKEPEIVECRNDIRSWKECIESILQNSRNIQIIVLLLNNYEEKYYKSLKKLITCNR